jgi:hypothetical protein
MKTEVKVIHFLKSAELRTGKKCFVRHVKIGKFDKGKIASKRTQIMKAILIRENIEDNVYEHSHLRGGSIDPFNVCHIC